MPRVVLHIGAFKTGTTFIQATLLANQRALAERGVLFHAVNRSAHYRAVRESLQRAPAAPATDEWADLVQACRSWSGEVAVVSAENLSKLPDRDVARVVEAFRPHPVHVVYGARDLVRTIPSQWNSRIRTTAAPPPTLHEYLEEIVADFSLAERRGRFWRTHHWPLVVRIWAEHVGLQNVTLLTAPRPGADPRVLWDRFGQAAQFDTSGLDLGSVNNQSMGAQSAELVRRIGARMAEGPTTARESRVLRVMSQHHFSMNRSNERGLSFLPEYGDWTRTTSEELMRALRETGVDAVGSIDELRPNVPETVPAGATCHPEELPEEEILAAAHNALRLQRRRNPVEVEAGLAGGAENPLDSAIDALVAIVRAGASSTKGGS